MQYSERVQVVEKFAQAVKTQFPQVDRYNILVFGSFLTERYSSDSDIDIGVFSLSPGIGFRLYSFTKEYFDNLGIPSDVVRMRLLDSQYINMSIVLGQQYAVTDYCPQELIDYTKNMIEKYGDNPQEAILHKMRQEAVV